MMGWEAHAAEFAHAKSCLDQAVAYHQACEDALIQAITEHVPALTLTESFITHDHGRTGASFRHGPLIINVNLGSAHPSVAVASCDPSRSLYVTDQTRPVNAYDVTTVLGCLMGLRTAMPDLSERDEKFVRSQLVAVAQGTDSTYKGWS